MNKILIIAMSCFASAFVSAAPADDVLTQRLQEIVNINSGSANLKGVQAVQEKIKPWFEDLGFKTELRANPTGATVSGPMLLATLAGQKTEAITLIMHADTVFEPSSPFQSSKLQDGGKMTGPGVIDDKGGIIVALEGLKQYLAALKVKNVKPKFTIQVEVTPNEEVGAIGWHEVFKDLSNKSWMALGFEPSLEGGLVEGRKGNVWYEISVTGKEAHAGVNHKLGINACAILAEKIQKIQKLTDYKRNYTTSIGHIEGGQDKYNIVCGWAKAKIDSRVPNLLVRNEMNKKIEAILKDPAISFKIVDETEPMPATAKSKPYVQRYLDTIGKVEGKRPGSQFSGGVGDANHFAREGLVVMDGLGPRGANMHTPEEYIELESLATRAHVFSEYLLSL